MQHTYEMIIHNSLATSEIVSKNMKAINDTPTPTLDRQTAFVGFYRNQHQRTFRLARLTNGGPDYEHLVQDAFTPVTKHTNRTINPPANLTTTIISIHQCTQQRQASLS